MTTSITRREPQAYYEPLAPGRYRSTVHTEGAWTTEHQHMAPVSGLLVHAIERALPRDDMILSRLAFDILGVIPTGEASVTAHVIRPGRTIELVEAELEIAGRVVVRATAWRLAASDTSQLAVTDIEPMPGPDYGTPWHGSGVWSGGYIRTLDFRTISPWRPGRARVWLHADTDLVSGEDASTLARYIGLVDTANGIAVRADPRTLMFVNTDLTVHLFRHPVDRWVGLDTTVSFGADGVGLTSSILHDTAGPIGQAAQTLTLRPLSEVRLPDATALPI